MLIYCTIVLESMLHLWSQYQ